MDPQGGATSIGRDDVGHPGPADAVGQGRIGAVDREDQPEPPGRRGEAEAEVGQRIRELGIVPNKLNVDAVCSTQSSAQNWIVTTQVLHLVKNQHVANIEIA